MARSYQPIAIGSLFALLVLPCAALLSGCSSSSDATATLKTKLDVTATSPRGNEDFEDYAFGEELLQRVVLACSKPKHVSQSSLSLQDVRSGLKLSKLEKPGEFIVRVLGEPEQAKMILDAWIREINTASTEQTDHAKRLREELAVLKLEQDKLAARVERLSQDSISNENSLLATLRIQGMEWTQLRDQILNANLENRFDAGKAATYIAQIDQRSDSANNQPEFLSQVRGSLGAQIYESPEQLVAAQVASEPATELSEHDAEVLRLQTRLARLENYNYGELHPAVVAVQQKLDVLAAERSLDLSPVSSIQQDPETNLVQVLDFLGQMAESVAESEAAARAQIQAELDQLTNLQDQQTQAIESLLSQLESLETQSSFSIRIVD